ncbi:MAG: hypothetical protein RMJ67_09390 [Elusimicrobiota bacterium]|nr:hypothetical protein [Endomicrobiia bacterium]MDW8166710.1 hypothetical protein [Elusimicrobiota bacterium]
MPVKKRRGKGSSRRKYASYTRKAARLKRNWGKTIVVFKRQTPVPRWNKKRDAKRRAKPPGVRVSRRGKIYVETRKNRSDRVGSRL